MVATLALRVAYHPNIFRVSAVTDTPAVRCTLVQGVLGAQTTHIVQPDGACGGGEGSLRMRRETPFSWVGPYTIKY